VVPAALFAQLTCGRYGACGLLLNGSVLCWNSDNQGIDNTL
jgi:hypothetical protein